MMIYSLKKSAKKKVQGVYLRAGALNPNRKPADLWAARGHTVGSLSPAQNPDVLLVMSTKVGMDIIWKTFP